MFQITYTDRFKKKFKSFTDQEKDQFRNKLKLFLSIHITLERKD